MHVQRALPFDTFVLVYELPPSGLQTAIPSLGEPPSMPASGLPRTTALIQLTYPAQPMGIPPSSWELSAAHAHQLVSQLV
jgi:hypothetical protein